ncbi:hypothetical protein RND81_03G179400 [Saponaria officinalis]|uniref:Uncharacterized protein n=1 Tax=Saponaria officinalis TaxID=3572 RepID=A0AAW1M4W9_SAPOF
MKIPTFRVFSCHPTLISNNRKVRHREIAPLCNKKQQRRRIITSIVACRRKDHQDDFGDGRRVDEDMIVLRLRIKEIEKADKGEEFEAPSNWMEWEKKYYMHFHEDVVYEVVGFLQLIFMDMRPSLALGVVTLVMLSVPLSIGVLMLHCLKLYVV